MFWHWRADVRDIKRFDRIAEAIVGFGLGSILHHARIKKVNDAERVPDNFEAEKLRALFEHLGGTFIKLGQLLSVRPDLIPAEYCNAFARLQDHVTEMPFSQAQEVIEKELKRPIDSIFKSIEKKALASASIAQVHRAVLKNGKQVAVKVQRPEVAALIDADMDILRFAAAKIKEHLHPKVFDPVQIVDEFEQYTRLELDFLQEAKNIEDFEKNFKKSRSVVIPHVFWPQSTSRVLVMNYIPGIELNRVESLSPARRKRIVRMLAEAVLKQIFVDGLFHADPHPGNILIMKGKSDRIAFVDFGIVGRIDDALKEKLKDLFIALINKDLEGISRSLIKMGFAPHSVDEIRLRDDLRLALGKYHNTELEKMDISDVFNRCLAVAKTHRIKLPKNFVLLGKSLVTLEGVGAEYDPSFNLVVIAKPFVETLLEDRFKQHLQPRRVARQALKDVGNLVQFARELPANTERIMSDMEERDRSLQNLDSDVRMLSRNISSAVTRGTFGLMIIALLFLTIFWWSTPPFTTTGVSVLSFCSFIAMLFFFAIFILMAHEERRRAFRQEEQ